MQAVSRTTTHEPLLTLADHFEVTEIGLVVRGEPTFDQWQQAGQVLRALNRTTKWSVGDWLLAGERRYGETYAQALDETEYTYQSLADITWVCRTWPYERRFPQLSFEHHRAVAPAPPKMQDYLMTLAIERHWTAAELRQARDNLMDLGIAATNAELDDQAEQDEAEGLDDPTPRSQRPRLICASPATVAAMTEDTVTVRLDRLAAQALPPGTQVYVQIVTVPSDES